MICDRPSENKYFFTKQQTAFDLNEKVKVNSNLINISFKYQKCRKERNQKKHDASVSKSFK